MTDIFQKIVDFFKNLFGKKKKEEAVKIAIIVGQITNKK